MERPPDASFGDSDPVRAILPAAFRHRLCPDLVRIGSDGDGGYVVSQGDVRRSDLLLSLGLGDDWSFERAFHGLSPVPIRAYDGSVNRKLFYRAAWQALKRRRLEETFEHLRNYRHFKRFFVSDRVHVRKFVGSPLYLSLDDIIRGIAARNIFVKMDIEGSEYRCLDALVENQHLLTGVVIEFHDVDLHLDRIVSFMEQFRLRLVHVHANNCAPVTTAGIPLALELSFSARPAPREPWCDYPSPLDRRNAADQPDIVIGYR
ncbi:hypothetical protein [Aquibium sp. ELW1220]|uniref:hypothetical protein n=1 Tax=Aquibium sp. ELW1220 TaxID=2976766 RepID=UPI0025B14B09|nr:hypothetical protein [Aquibium sp. ELW1220]MDN2582846.1 FkbM family methyltransferase [Aquibium sp. ELW1220]